jgi:hypothetical protein
VQIFRTADGTLVTDFAPYGPSYSGGVTVAMGDIIGDGYDDLVTGATVGNPHVKVYSGAALANGSFSAVNPDARLLTQFFAYGLNFNVGVNVAVGDVNGDGYADIVTGATAGNPDVRVYNGQDIARGTFQPDGASQIAQFFAYGLNFNVGVNVAVGDVNGDGFVDIITGSSTGNPEVKVYDGRASTTGGLTADTADAHVLDDFFAYPLGSDIGTTVAAADFESTGHFDILTGATQGPATFQVLRANGTAVGPATVFQGTLAGFPAGIFVGA